MTVRYQPFLLDDSVPVENPPAFHDYMHGGRGAEISPRCSRVSQGGRGGWADLQLRPDLRSPPTPCSATASWP